MMLLLHRIAASLVLPQYQHQIFATLASLYDQVKAQEPGKKRKLFSW
jgi:hypothetical protein